MRMWSCHHRQSRSSCQYLGRQGGYLYSRTARGGAGDVFIADGLSRRTNSGCMQCNGRATLLLRNVQTNVYSLAWPHQVSLSNFIKALARKRAFIVRLHRASVSLDEIEWAVPGATTADDCLHENRWRRSVSPAVLLCCTCLRQSRCTRYLRSRRSPLPSTCLRMQSRR